LPSVKLVVWKRFGGLELKFGVGLLEHRYQVSLKDSNPASNASLV